MKKLSEPISKSLDKIVEALKDEFVQNNNLDFERLCKVYNIKYHETPKTMIPFVRYGEEFHHIVNFPSWFRQVREYSRAHELTHVILKHNKRNIRTYEAEEEANYLAENLTGISRKICYTQALEVFFRTCGLLFAEPNNDKLISQVS